MGILSEHFNRQEFSCKCKCGFNDISDELIQVLEDVREHFDSPVIINSGCRCEKHNLSIGGTTKSKHLAGIAADIVVKDVLAEIVQEYLRATYPDKYGIGSYQDFSHCDIRTTKARW